MKKSILISPILFLTLIFNVALAEEVTIWGPNKYLRTAGSPNNYTSVFSTTPGQGKLVVKNGTMVGSKRVRDSLSSATISVNGEQIFGPSDFNKQVYLLEALLNLAENNEFSIELASSPDSYLTIEIVKDIDLPADPGNAGKETLLGIDSDNDGVRDDIQRYIYVTYPNEEKVRLSLTQIAKNYQELLPDSGDPEKAYENVKKLNRSRSCLYYIKNGIRGAKDIADALFAKILNTEERSLAYLEFSNNLAGKTLSLTPIKDRKSCCLFDVDTIGDDQ
ncbi:hypothetical protein [Desulfobacula phenolica]|uniref:Uncharacterized protein n=1 Tax=Desulfobacula phenolica TaxID=90732 RepID=A0A1H2KDC2_9BACT|nr:hypothetical protein [Desulfobacula phenolica]SDU66649.1 hypothetical protein SAMN04487931_1334 [Desulfobacula phenolica]